jgi:ParB/RepB/Spo0J family partition protein
MSKAQSDRTTFAAEEAAINKQKVKGFKGKIELQALKVEMVDTTLLKPNPYNPNKQNEEEFELLKASIHKDGFTMPVLANIQYVIIDGEHRWQAALAEGIKRIPVVRLDLDDARMKMSTLRHNKARGTHDADLEAMVLADLEKLVGADFIFEELQIDRDTLDEVLNFVSAAEDLAGEEFSQSWTPVKNDSVFSVDAEGKPKSETVFTVRKSVDTAFVLRSATNAANDLAYRKVELKDVEASKAHLYTVTAVIAPDMAQHVKDVLENTEIPGDTPAQRLHWLAEQAAA